MPQNVYQVLYAAPASYSEMEEGDIEALHATMQSFIDTVCPGKSVAGTHVSEGLGIFGVCTLSEADADGLPDVFQGYRRSDTLTRPSLDSVSGMSNFRPFAPVA